MMALTTFVVGLSAAAALPPPPPPPPSSLSPSVVSTLREAMALTTRSNEMGDLSAAKEAAHLWDTILTPRASTTTSRPSPPRAAGGDALVDPLSAAAPPPPPPPRALLPDGVLALSHALRASALSRLGRDSEAVSSYSAVLDNPSLRRHLNADSLRDASVGRGDALQRLMRYDEAAGAFRECAESTMRGAADEDGGNCISESEASAADRSMCRAATCLLRSVDDDELGTRRRTLELLQDHTRRRGWSPDDAGRWDRDVAGMTGTLLWLTTTGADDEMFGADEAQALALLQHASESGGSPLYSWMYELALASLGRRPELSLPPSTLQSFLNDELDDDDDSFLLLASVNQYPFDEPRLIHLDDKILLHRLLEMPTPQNASSSCDHFFPEGFVLPDDAPAFREYISSTPLLGSTDDARAAWILKERSGYGGHGCRVVTTAQALRHCADLEKGQMHDWHDSVLCQRLIDPPLLMNGRKFSLRVYVVYFPSDGQDDGGSREAGEVFISMEGLAKFAMVPYDASATPGGGDDDVANADADIDVDVDAGFVSDAYLTNSGRGNGGAAAASQYTFAQLRAELESSGELAGGEEEEEGGWDGVWSDVQEAVRATMGRYLDMVSTSRAPHAPAPARRPPQPPPPPRTARILLLPKIMGFDFLLSRPPGSGAARPFLLEVNRFPGLEPRSEEDAYVKRRVVSEAWQVARTLAGFDDNEEDRDMWLKPLQLS